MKYMLVFLCSICSAMAFAQNQVEKDTYTDVGASMSFQWGDYRPDQLGTFDLNGYAYTPQWWWSYKGFNDLTPDPDFADVGNPGDPSYERRFRAVALMGRFGSGWRNTFATRSYLYLRSMPIGSKGWSYYKKSSENLLKPFVFKSTHGGLVIAMDLEAFSSINADNKDFEGSNDLKNFPGFSLGVTDQNGYFIAIGLRGSGASGSAGSRYIRLITDGSAWTHDADSSSSDGDAYVQEHPPTDNLAGTQWIDLDPTHIGPSNHMHIELFLQNSWISVLYNGNFVNWGTTANPQYQFSYYNVQPTVTSQKWLSTMWIGRRSATEGCRYEISDINIHARKPWPPSPTGTTTSVPLFLR